jgi:hypothetical protein
MSPSYAASALREDIYCFGHVKPSTFVIFPELSAFLNNAVLWDVIPRCPCKNRPFGATYRLHHQGEKINELRTTIAVTTEESAFLII